MIAALRRWWSSIAFRLAFIYGALVMGSMLVVLAVSYQATIGFWERRIDGQIDATTQRLTDYFQRRGAPALAAHISELLGDGIDSDTEIYTLVDADGRKLAGNLDVTRELLAAAPDIGERRVRRAGRASQSRLRMTRLPGGAVLLVGRDMRDQRELGHLVRRASLAAAGIALVLALAGALAFRREIERRIGAIRQAALQIERGDLSQRVPVSQQEDEFARLARDLNAMLDRIHALMDGVRHVSNTIAHNLRTPLSRILANLRSALAAPEPMRALPAAAQLAVNELEDLTVVFEKLLQIAEVESGARRRGFGAVSLQAVAVDVLEFYDALAEEKRVALTHALDPAAIAIGDGDLIASALANLIDNAIKYTEPGGQVCVESQRAPGQVALCVRDDGCGIPAAERSRIGERFHRLDRDAPGWGLGLSSVIAIARLHGGSLELDDAHPGLVARLILPAADTR